MLAESEIVAAILSKNRGNSPANWRDVAAQVFRTVRAISRPGVDATGSSGL